MIARFPKVEFLLNFEPYVLQGLARAYDPYFEGSQNIKKNWPFLFGRPNHLDRQIDR